MNLTEYLNFLSYTKTLEELGARHGDQRDPRGGPGQTDAES